MALSDGAPYTGIQGRLKEEMGTPEPPPPRPLSPDLQQRAQSAADWVNQQTIGQQRDQAQADLNAVRAARGTRGLQQEVPGEIPQRYTQPLTPSEQTGQTRAALEAEQNAYQMRHYRQQIPPDAYNELLRRLAPAERARQLYGAAGRTADIAQRAEQVDIRDYGYDPSRADTWDAAYNRAGEEALRRQRMGINAQIYVPPAEQWQQPLQTVLNYGVNKPLAALGTAGEKAALYSPLGQAIEHAPAEVAGVPVRAPLQTGRNLVGQGAAFAAADVLTGGAANLAYSVQAADSAAKLSDAYAAGQLTGEQYAQALGLTLGPLAAGAIAPHVLQIGPQAARDVAQWLRSPEARQSFRVPEPVNIARPALPEFQTELGVAPGATRAAEMQTARDLGLATSATVRGMPSEAAYADAARQLAANPQQAARVALEGATPPELTPPREGAIGAPPPGQLRVAPGEAGVQRLGFGGEQGRPLLEPAHENPAELLGTLKKNPKGMAGWRGLPNDNNALPGRAINTAEDLAATRTHVEGLVQQGEQGRFWYENASKNILDGFRGSKLAAQRFTGVLALLSNSATVESNTANALRIMNQWAAGHKITGAGTADQVLKIKAFLDNPHANAGALKTNAFYLALLRNIDPAAWRAMRQHLPTVDVHIGRAYGFDVGTRVVNGVSKDKSISASQYVFPARDILRITDKLNKNLAAGERPWTYDQVQAAMWTGQKATTQGQGVTQAALNYGDVLQRHVAGVSVESAPGATWRRSDGGPQLEGFDSAPAQVKNAYHRDMMGAVTDSRGNNTLAASVGVGQGAPVRGTGVFEGGYNPATHFQVYTSTAKGGVQSGVVGAESVELLNALTAAHGLVFHQDAGAWSRVFPLADKYRQNAVALNVGRALKPAELAAIEDGLRQRGYEPAIVTTKSGAYILDTGQEAMLPGQAAAVKTAAGARTKAFQDVADEVIASSLPERESVQTAGMGYHSGYLENNWSANPNGEGYQGHIDRAGIAPATRRQLGAAVREASGKAEAINRSYADRYGWKYEPARPGRGAAHAEHGALGAAAATRLGTTATGAAIGGSIGDSPEDRARNALIGAGLGALTGEGVLRLGPHLLEHPPAPGELAAARGARTFAPEDLQAEARRAGLMQTHEQLAVDRGQIAPGGKVAQEVPQSAGDIRADRHVLRTPEGGIIDYRGTHINDVNNAGVAGQGTQLLNQALEDIRSRNPGATVTADMNSADGVRLFAKQPGARFTSRTGEVLTAEQAAAAASRFEGPQVELPSTGTAVRTVGTSPVRTPGANPVTAEDIMGTGAPASGADVRAMSTNEVYQDILRQQKAKQVGAVEQGVAELQRRAADGDIAAEQMLGESEIRGQPVQSSQTLDAGIINDNIRAQQNARSLAKLPADRAAADQQIKFLVNSLQQKAGAGDRAAGLYLKQLDMEGEVGRVGAQIAARAGGAATGAAIGAATGNDRESRLRNALIGAGIGAAATEALIRSPLLRSELGQTHLPGESNKLGFNPTEEELAHFRDVIERGDWTTTPGARVGAKAALNMLIKGEAPSDKQLAMLYRALEQPPPPELVKPTTTAAEFTRTTEQPPAAEAAGGGAAAPPELPPTTGAPQPPPGLPPSGGVQGQLGVTPSTSHATPAEMKAGLEGAYPQRLPEQAPLPLGTPQERAAQHVLDTAISGILDSAQPYQRLMAFLRHIGTGVSSTLGFVKTFKTAFDLSWAGRQGWRLLPANPREWGEAFKMQFRAAGSEKGYHAINDAARAFPLFERTQQLSQHGGRDAAYLELGNLDPAHSAEDFLSPITKHVPLLNRSERAFVAPGNWMRQAVIDKLARDATDNFAHPITDHDLQLIVDMTNDATLRGNTKWLGKVNGELAGSLLFSTKGLVSGPQFAADGLRAVLDRSYSPRVRYLVAKQVASYIGTGTAMLGLAALGGYGLDKAGKPVFVKVHANPYDTNFGQIEVGGFRWNYWGNDATLVRTAIQVSRGREQRPAFPTLEASRRRLAVNYIGNKIAPGIPALAFNEVARSGRDITGQNINTPKGFAQFAWDQVDPILASNIIDAYRNLGAGGAAATAPAELFGATTSTYQPTEGDIRAGTKAKVQQKLDAAGITTLEDQGWKSDYWQRALEPVGGPTTGFGSFDDYRKNYINTWTQYGVDHGKSYGDAVATATNQFDSQGAVQQWHKDLAGARLQKWREHPELLKEAYDAGSETLSKAEAKILDDYIKSLQQQPAGATP